jgi:hypothetical protein
MILPVGNRLHWTVVQYLTVDPMHYFCTALRAFVASLKEGADEALVDEARRDSGTVIHYGAEPSRILCTREVQCGIEKVQQSLQSCL